MTDSIKHRGKIFFFSGPSGVGKGTLIQSLKNNHPEWVFPPSCTTRKPRPNEKDGETYFFITKTEFQQKITDGDFLEWAQVHDGNLYGTLKEKILFPVSQGHTVIREFDVQGFLQARTQVQKNDFIGIFLAPENGWKDLEPRIIKRAPMSAEELKNRQESFENEMKNKSFYDKIFLVKENGQKNLLNEVETFIKNHNT